MTTHRKLVARLVGAVAVAFAASMVMTWLLHDRMASREAYALIDSAIRDVEASIREKVDKRMIHQAIVVRDLLADLRKQEWWNDPDESSKRLREIANELGVDEICVADNEGLLTHSARRDEVGALNFVTATGQAHEFAELLGRKTEIVQPLMPNTLRGSMVKYVGVWIPEGGFVQVGARSDSLRRLSRSAVTGITHNWRVSGEDGFIVVTSAQGTVISHSDETQEGAQWTEPDPEEAYCKKQTIEGFPVYVVVPKKMAIVERRVLVGTSAFLNAMALIFAAFLVGIVIAAYVRSQLQAQREKEMSMAATIQESAVPRTFPPFPGERSIDIFADMHTAKEVGGDFYDFYFTGPHKVTFLIADVSDKGVPAALFMMRAKATIKGIAQTGCPIDEVITKANDALSQDNGANMFVTVWIGEIDFDTGKVTYVNAGHNQPIVLRPSTDEPVAYIKTRASLVLGAVEGTRYRSQELQLAPGEGLYLYTDGITEQHNGHAEMFGEERLLSTVRDTLKSNPEFVTLTSSPIIDTVFAQVTKHSGETAQSDDRTQLVIRYNGPKPQAS